MLPSTAAHARARREPHPDSAYADAGDRPQDPHDGMKVVGGGSELSKDPGRAIRYSMGIPGVHAVVLGMMDEDQIEENLGFVSELISA